MNPRDRLRSVGRRLTDPAEALAQQVAERIVDLVVNALDVNQLVARVDLNALMSRVDLDVVLKKVDLNALLDQVDLNALLDRVDVNTLIDQVDLNAVMSRVDLDPLLDRVDVNELVSRIDMDALVQNTDLGAVVARSSGGVASEVLDATRSQAVGLDQFVDRWVRRVLRRKQSAPLAPPALLHAQAEVISPQAAAIMPPREKP